MHIIRLLVRGFRSLKDFEVALQPGLNVLVGKNNSGKSNVMRALNLLFGEKWPTYQEFDDTCFFGQGEDKTDHFLIAVWLMPGLVYMDDSFTVWYKLSETEPDWDDFSTLLEPEGRKQPLRGSQFSNNLARAEEVILYLVVPREGHRKERIFSLVVKCQEGGWMRITLSQELRDAIITTALIPAFRDPRQQLKITNYTWYGKLILQIYNTRSDEQAEIIKELPKHMKEITDEIFRQSTDNLREFLSDVIFHNRIGFQIGSDLKDDIYKQIMLFVDDGVDTPYYDKGSGIQSALVIGLFTYYCKTFHQGSSLLLVEEPELYLHSQARRTIESRLVDFVAEATENCERQVILSTHSPEFLKSVDLQSIIRVYKEPNSDSTMHKKIENLDKTTLAKYRQVIHTKNTEMFFADSVILVECGEEYILPALANKRYGIHGVLDTKNVSVIRVGGKGQFPIYIDVLERLGIKWAVLADLDFVVQGLEQFGSYFDYDFLANLGKFKEAINKERAQIRSKAVKKTLHPETRD